MMYLPEDTELEAGQEYFADVEITPALNQLELDITQIRNFAEQQAQEKGLMVKILRFEFPNNYVKMERQKTITLYYYDVIRVFFTVEGSPLTIVQAIITAAFWAAFLLIGTTASLRVIGIGPLMRGMLEPFKETAEATIPALKLGLIGFGLYVLLQLLPLFVKK